MTRPKGPKTERIPFANQATEVGVGRWQWSVGGRVWEYREGAGINLTLIESEDRRVGAGFFPSIREAAYFAEGFVTGAGHARQQGKATPKTLDKAAEDVNLEFSRPEEPTSPGQ